jgi:hypothetical protein
MDKPVKNRPGMIGGYEMNATKHRKLTGLLFVVGAVLINVPYTLLIMGFDYPDILRQPAGTILTRYQQGGPGLTLTWLAFALVGIPVLFAIVMLQNVLEREDTPYLWSGTVAGVIGGIAQMIGLLRWVFVVPVLASIYTDPASSSSMKEAVAVVFQAVHQYGGVALGEHIGQIFTILWMLLVSFAMFRSRLFRPWLAWLGILASVVYALAQTELLATVLPDFPVVPQAGLVGSLLWLAWMTITGLFLMRARTDVAQGK